jgi:hypothetical protein
MKVGSLQKVWIQGQVGKKEISGNVKILVDQKVSKTPEAQDFQPPWIAIVIYPFIW